jgi:hypothetical protein
MIPSLFAPSPQEIEKKDKNVSDMKLGKLHHYLVFLDAVLPSRHYFYYRRGWKFRSLLNLLAKPFDHLC